MWAYTSSAKEWGKSNSPIRRDGLGLRATELGCEKHTMLRPSREGGHLVNPNTRAQHSAPPATRPRTNWAKCCLSVQSRWPGGKSWRRRPQARWKATQLTGTEVAAQILTPPPTRGRRLPAAGRREPGAGLRGLGSEPAMSRRYGSPRAIYVRAPTLGAPPGQRGARCRLRGPRRAAGGGAKRRQPQRRGMARVPRPRTHAGFMAAGSAMPRRARGTPSSLGRAGETASRRNEPHETGRGG